MLPAHRRLLRLWRDVPGLQRVQDGGVVHDGVARRVDGQVPDADLRGAVLDRPHHPEPLLAAGTLDGGARQGLGHYGREGEAELAGRDGQEVRVDAEDAAVGAPEVERGEAAGGDGCRDELAGVEFFIS